MHVSCISLVGKKRKEKKARHRHWFWSRPMTINRTLIFVGLIVTLHCTSKVISISKGFRYSINIAVYNVVDKLVFFLPASPGMKASSWAWPWGSSGAWHTRECWSKPPSTCRSGQRHWSGAWHQVFAVALLCSCWAWRTFGCNRHLIFGSSVYLWIMEYI